MTCLSDLLFDFRLQQEWLDALDYTPLGNQEESKWGRKQGALPHDDSFFAARPRQLPEWFSTCNMFPHNDLLLLFALYFESEPHVTASYQIDLKCGQNVYASLHCVIDVYSAILPAAD